MRLAIAVEDGFVAQDETVTADDFLHFRVPQDQLAVSIGGVRVEFVDVQGFSRAAAAVPESDFAEPADFPDDVRGILVGDHVEFVAGAVGFPQQAFRR